MSEFDTPEQLSPRPAYWYMGVEIIEGHTVWILDKNDEEVLREVPSSEADGTQQACQRILDYFLENFVDGDSMGGALFGLCYWNAENDPYAALVACDTDADTNQTTTASWTMPKTVDALFTRRLADRRDESNT